MASKAKSRTTKTTIRKRLPGDLDPISGEGDLRIRKGDWLLLPLGVLVAISLYTVWDNFPNVLPNSVIGIFFASPFVALLISLFSLLYIYKTARRSPRHIVAKAAAYVLSFLLITAVIYIGMISGGGVTYFGLYVFLYNPYTMPIVVVLSIAGIVSFLAKREAQVTMPKHAGATLRTLSLRARIALIVSLAVVSIFPVFITLAPQEWPPQPGVIVIDAIYPLILAGYLLVLTGQNRSKWLVVTVTVISIVGVAAMGWLAFTLATFNISW